jgi:ABC-type multidrug transport system ATPase subunit
VLLDEPFTGLDDRSAAALTGRLVDLRTRGAIVIVATHDLDLAEGLLDEALFLRDGRVVERRANPEGLRAVYRSIMARPQPGAAGQP